MGYTNESNLAGIFFYSVLKKLQQYNVDIY